MNKSFKKIINLEENISINDLKAALECFITIEDEKLKEEFLSKCKRVIISLVNNLLPLVDEYPTSISYDKTVFKIDRLLYWANFLYGNNIFPLFTKDIQNINDGKKITTKRTSSAFPNPSRITGKKRGSSYSLFIY